MDFPDISASGHLVGLSMALTLDLRGFTQHGELLQESSKLRLERGQAVALVGCSGSGKSSLLHLLAGLHPQSRGVFDDSVEREDDLDGNLTIGYLGADPDLFLTGFCQTVREEVGWSLFLDGWELAEILRRVEETLETLGLLALADLDPRQLSGGQRQLVALAAVWARQPHFLLLDEPASRLDPLAHERLRSLVSSLYRDEQVGVVWSTSEMGQVRWCDTIWYLENRSVRICPAENFDPVSADLVLSWPQEWARLGGLEVPPWTAMESPQGATIPHLPAPVDPQPILEVDEVWFESSLEQPLFQGLSCQLGRAERIALVGPNGAGKTTLGRLLRGLARPFRGEIRSGQVCLSREPVWLTAQTVSYTFQDPTQLLARNRVDDELLHCGELLDWSQEKARARMEEALSLFELDRLRARHPRELAASQGALLALAVSWLVDAPVQIFDEPLARLDRHGREVLRRALESWTRAGTTLVFIAHDLDWLSTVCQRFLVLDSGRLIADGPAQTVFAEPTVRRILGAPLPLRALE